MNGNGTGPQESPPVRQVILGGPTIRLTVEMQIRDRAAHYQIAVRLAPGSTDSHAAVIGDEAAKAVRDLATYLAIDKVDHPQGRAGG